MAFFTTILNLLKKNPATDGADTFNIQTMLNDNWDKIDNALGLVGVRADVRAATTGNVTLSGLQTVDGVALATGDRVLVKNQTTASQNGVYVAAAGPWVRAADADSSAKLMAGANVYVQSGTASGGTGWTMSRTGALILDTTAITFVQQTGPGAATDAVIGKRTIDDSVAVGTTDTDSATGLLSRMGGQIRAVTGGAHWYTPPAASLSTIAANVQASASPTAISLKPGVSVYNVSRKSRLTNLKMQGRTLVNLLGRTSNFDNSINGITNEINVGLVDSVTSVSDAMVGTKSLKLRAINSIDDRYITIGDSGSFKVSSGKYYIVLGYAKPLTNAALVHLEAPLTRNDVSLTKNIWNSFYIKSQASADGNLKITFNRTSQYDYIQLNGLRAYEISAAEFAALGSSLTDSKKILAQYPYVDDVKHVNALYFSNPGRNLLPSFSDWDTSTFNYNFANSIISSYKLKTTIASANGAVGALITIPALPNQTYSFSCERNDNTTSYMRIISVANMTDTSNQSLWLSAAYFSGSSGTFTTPIGTNFIQVYLGNLDNMGTSLTGTFTYSNPMLVLGSVPATFEPQRPSYLYLPDCQLRSNFDGSVADTLYTDGQGRPRVVRRFKEVVLDGNLTYDSPGLAGTGARVIRTTIPTPVKNTGTVVKYSGKMLSAMTQGTPFTTADQQVVLDSSDGWPNTLSFSVASSDSGWADSYNPSTDEIKAYFYGWVMFNADAAAGSTPDNPANNRYNGSGTKAWARRLDGVTRTWVDGTATLPSNIAPALVPYRLIYQLAASVDEPINYEGDLMLHDGANQIEVGTGVVVREISRPGAEPTTANIWLNTLYTGSGIPVTNLLKNRAKKALAIYRNGEVDKKWTTVIGGNGYSFGLEDYAISNINYDSSATYSITYLVLDTHTLGIVPASIEGEYAPNVKESLDSITRDITEAKTQLSALQATKSQKQQPQWIAPTLLSGWINYSASFSPVGYYKDALGIVHLRGMIANGVAGNIFILPAGYRPAYGMAFSMISAATSGGTGVLPATVNLSILGTLSTAVNPQSGWITLEGITFLAEQ